MALYQREEYNKFTRHSDYPPIPEADLYQNGSPNGPFWDKPTKIEGWEWSVSFGNWSVLAEFANGWRGYTWPQRLHAYTVEVVISFSFCEDGFTVIGERMKEYGAKHIAEGRTVYRLPLHPPA